MNAITIKGNKDGLTVFVNSGEFNEAKDELLSRIKRARAFFSGNKITIVDSQKKLTKENYLELEKELKNEYDIILKYNLNEYKNEKINKAIVKNVDDKTKFLKNTIRSGQKVVFNGNIVIIGDVNSGAEVIASGNIVIMGVLRGIAHAGCNGNRKAIVSAYMLQPSQLRIADIITRAPDEWGEKPKIPENAKIKDDMIVIEPYLPNKYL